MLRMVGAIPRMVGVIPRMVGVVPRTGGPVGCCGPSGPLGRGQGPIGCETLSFWWTAVAPSRQRPGGSRVMGHGRREKTERSSRSVPIPNWKGLVRSTVTEQPRPFGLSGLVGDWGDPPVMGTGNAQHRAASRGPRIAKPKDNGPDGPRTWVAGTPVQDHRTRPVWAPIPPGAAAGGRCTDSKRPKRPKPPPEV